MFKAQVEVRLPIIGMTCTGCEAHVIQALNKIGALNATANFKRGEATFQFNDPNDIETAINAISRIGYVSGKAEMVHHSSDAETKYDLVIIGSGGAAFSAAIEASKYEAKILINCWVFM